MEMRLLEEATLVDPSTGSTLYNLAQQDMVAFRFTMRLGAAIPNPVNRVSGQLNSGSTNIIASAAAYPFAIITKTAAGSN